MTVRPSRSAWDDVIPLLLFLVAVALLVPRLNVAPDYMFDEVYHAYTAGQYVAGNADAFVWDTKSPRAGVAYMWNHPPAGVLAIAGGILLWGDNPIGWRFSSAAFGALGIGVAYLLALRLTGRRSVAILTACLLLVDGLYFCLSRIAMLDIFGLVFSMGALFSLHAFLTAPPHRAGWPLVRTGAFVGLALATKWNAAYLAALTGIVLLHRAAGVRRDAALEGATAQQRSAWRVQRIGLPIGLFAVPLAVYLAVYLPFFAHGNGLARFVELQKQIFHYHTGLEASHPWASRFWEWPLALRPVWFWSRYVDETGANIFANGNLVLYWAFLPAVAWLGLRWWRESNPGLTVLLIGFFGQWLPWALSPRIAFAYHFLPAVPFGALAVAFAVANLVRAGGIRRALALVYLAAVLACFGFFFPFYAGLPLGQEAFELRMWFDSWRPV